MRCDGMKPACQQCVRAKKAEGCEYDDGKGKTRTQLMREHISRLEMRIKELEHPDQSSPAVTLYDPHVQASFGSASSSSSSYGSPGTVSIPACESPSPFPIEAEASWEAQWTNVAEFSSSQGNDSYGPSEDPPLELAQMFLEIFLPHRHQCGLELHVGRLRESLTFPVSEQHHPVLMNAIYLWACYLSRPGQLSEHEPLYLSRAVRALNDAVEYPTKIIDLIQGACLLSVYYLSNGQLFQGNYYASTAASLAVHCGLHQIQPDDLTPQVNAVDWNPPFKLEPAKDAIEQGERILAFWQVFNLDRCWSVALHRPAVLSDNNHSWTRISTPWPQRMEDYEAGEVDITTDLATVCALFKQQGDIHSNFSTLALRTKVSALFESANRISSGWNAQIPVPSSFSDNFRMCEHAITRFTTTLLPLHQVGAAIPDDKFALIVIHSLAHAAMICLHSPFMQDNNISRQKCVRSARSVIMVTKHIAEADFDYLDPILGPCWLSAAKVLELEVVRLQASWPPVNALETQGELGSLVYAMTQLSSRFPLLGYQASKVQTFLESK